MGKIVSVIETEHEFNLLAIGVVLSRAYEAITTEAVSHQLNEAIITAIQNGILDDIERHGVNIPGTEQFESSVPRVLESVRYAFMKAAAARQPNE